jgi:hypothetical protein
MISESRRSKCHVIELEVWRFVPIVDLMGSISRSAQSLKEPPSEERVPTFTEVWWVRSTAVSGIFKGPSGSKGRLGSKGLTRIWPRDREPPGVYSHPRTKIQVFLCVGIMDELGGGSSQPLWKY